MFFQAGFTIHSREPQPGQSADRAEERQQVRVQVVRLRDVTGHLDRRPPVRERDEVAARDLPAEPRQVLGRQVERRQELDQRDVVDRIGRHRMIVARRGGGRVASRCPGSCRGRPGLHRRSLALVGHFLDDLPGIAVHRAEGLGRLPVQRRQDRMPDASIGRPGSRRGSRPGPRRRGDAQDDPALLPEPEHPEPHVDEDRADQQETASSQHRHCFRAEFTRVLRFGWIVCTIQPRSRAWNRASHASTTDRTAASTSSPVSVRSGWRNAMPKWTLCLILGEVPALERVQVLDRLQRRPRRADDRLGQIAPKAIRVPRPAKGRGPRAGNGGIGRYCAPARPLSIGHRARARPPSTPRGARIPGAAPDRPRRDSPGGSRPASSSAGRPAANRGISTGPRRQRSRRCAGARAAPRRSP